MADNEVTYFDQLFVKVKKLLQLTSALQLENHQLKAEVKRLRDNRNAGEADLLPEEVEQQLVQLRKENRMLRDREKLIRNKIDRLSVKLDDLHT